MSGGPASRPTLWAAVVAAAAATALHAGLAPEALLWIAPALLLVVPLIAGRFPGEAAIDARRRDRRTRPPRRREARSVATRPRPAGSAPPGGLLIAFRLAERGPPAVVLAA